MQVLLALIPLMLTPVLLYLIAEGRLDFGGGEKDLILLLPWLIWSVLFAVCSLVLIYRRWALAKWAASSAALATVGLFALGLVAHFYGVLGVASS